MSTSEIFKEFLSNIAITSSSANSISSKYEEITCALNKKFRNTESKTANSLQVGSYGRWTGINGISDLDMLYIMPSSEWNNYKDGKQSKLLDDTRDAIKKRYPNTEVKKDKLVVQINYHNFTVEVQPVFEQDDRSFKYPDSYDSGSWKITKPCEEIHAMKEFVEQKNKNLRKLCKMIRAWKNKCGLGVGGLLIDTLAYNFLKSTEDYDNRSFAHYDYMCRDFFKYLSDEPEKDYYLALGSNQHVKVKSKFQSKAKEAYNLCTQAIDENNEIKANRFWRRIFGRSFPSLAVPKHTASAYDFDNTEEFIENLYPVDIKYNLKIECEVSQDGFREYLLRTMLAKKLKLKPKKKLLFYIVNYDLPENCAIKWKVLNVGDEAERRNNIRGEIVSDDGFRKKNERTLFKGEHKVECYAVKNGVVIARDRIDVPITI